MRILIDATPLQTGHRQRGVGTYTRELLRALLALDRANDYGLVVHPGFEISVVGSGIPEWPNVRLLRLPRPPLGRLTGFVTHQVLLPALLASQQADLFHSPGFVAAFSVPGVPWRCPMPLIVTLHDFIPLHVPELSLNKALNRCWYPQQMRMASRADALICVSEATRQDALRFLAVPPGRCVVVHEGVDRQVFRPLPEPAVAKQGSAERSISTGSRQVHEPAAPFILFVGGDYPNKNRQAALATFARLCQASKLPHDLMLVGPDATPGAELHRRYPGLDLTRVRRLNDLPQAELAQLYRQADVLLFPSTCEGFGLPVLEAMASGTPVITSALSSLPEVAGEAAILIDPHNIDALAAALGNVLASPALRERLRAAGLARAAELTWERMAQETLAVYRQILS